MITFLQKINETKSTNLFSNDPTLNVQNEVAFYPFRYSIGELVLVIPDEISYIPAVIIGVENEKDEFYYHLNSINGLDIDAASEFVIDFNYLKVSKFTFDEIVNFVYLKRKELEDK